jgi:hypothetical protein
METIRVTIAAVVDRIAEDPGSAKILLARHVGSSRFRIGALSHCRRRHTW